MNVTEYRFFLFRLIIRSKTAKKNLFTVDKGQLLKKLITSQPQGEVRKDQIWVVSSEITNFDSINGFHFEFGRIGKKEKSAYDPEQAIFLNEEGEEVEYTNCFFFPTEQVLAIRSGRGINVQPKSIAKYLCKLLQRMVESEELLSAEERVILQKSNIIALPIKNPNSFIELINKAYKVTTYTIEYGKPNPPNYKSLIQKPIEEITEHTGAETGALKLKNKKGLETKPLEDISRSAAIMDSTVSAKIHADETDSLGTTIKMQRAEDFHIDIPESDLTNKMGKVATVLLNCFKTIAPTNNRK
ncbi:hypothetical protein JCM16814_17920 [Desulfobaculum senezii]